MKILIHSQNLVVQPLKFGNGLLTSNLGNSGSSCSCCCNISSTIIVIDAFKWNPRQGQRCSSDDMEHVKMANAFQTTAILKLMVKTKSHHELLKVHFAR